MNDKIEIDMQETFNRFWDYACELDDKVQTGKLSMKQATKFQFKLQEWLLNAKLISGQAPQTQMGEKDMSANQEEVIKDIISELAFVNNVKKGHDLREDLELDDEAIEELAEELEHEFDIEIGEDEFEKWETVKDVINYVKNNTGGFDE